MIDPQPTQTVDTPRGPVEYLDTGAGEPELFVHGSPGGCDQGGRHLVDRPDE